MFFAVLVFGKALEIFKRGVFGGLYSSCGYDKKIRRSACIFDCLYIEKRNGAVVDDGNRSAELHKIVLYCCSRKKKTVAFCVFRRF